MIATNTSPGATIPTLPDSRWQAALIKQFYKLFSRQIRIAKNLTQQTASDVPTRMNWNCKHTAVSVLQSEMAPFLTNGFETSFF
jgi:hypothetical protein